MDSQRRTDKDLNFLRSYFAEFNDKLSFDKDNGYFYNEKKKLWVIQKQKNIYIVVRNITEKFFPNESIPDSNIIDWTGFLKKSLHKARLSPDLILTNNKIYDIKCETFVNSNDCEPKNYIFMYTPLNIKRIKKL